MSKKTDHADIVTVRTVEGFASGRVVALDGDRATILLNDGRLVGDCSPDGYTRGEPPAEWHHPVELPQMEYRAPFEQGVFHAQQYRETRNVDDWRAIAKKEADELAAAEAEAAAAEAAAADTAPGL